MRIYGAVIRLHDIEDVEELCQAAANRAMPGLPYHEFEDLVRFLVERVWWSSTRYDTAWSSSFEATVRPQLRNRCIDWFRQTRGRTRWQFKDHIHEREARRSVSFDVFEERGDDGDFPDRAVGEADYGVDGDPAAGGGTDLFGGLLDGRDSDRASDTALIRALARQLLRDRGSRARAA